MSLLESLRQPPSSARPVTIWSPDPSWAEADVDRQLRAIRDRGWGGVLLGEDGVETLLMDDRSPSFYFAAMKRARELDLSVWLHGGPLLVNGALAREIALAEPDFRLWTAEFVAKTDAQSGAPLNWSLERPLQKPLIVGSGVQSGAVDITQCYHGGMVKGAAPCPIDQAWAFECAEHAERINPFHPEAVRILLRETFGVLAEIFLDNRTLVDGVYLPPEEVDLGPAGSAPWHLHIVNAFQRRFGAHALESLPYLFTEGLDGAAHRWRYRQALRDQWREALWTPVKDMASRLQWRIAGLAEWSSPPFPNLPLSPSTPLFDWLDGGEGWGVLGDDPYQSLADLAQCAQREYLHGSRRIVSFYSSFVPRPRVESDRFDPTLEPLEHWIDGFNLFASRVAHIAQHSGAQAPVLLLDSFDTAQAAYSLTENGRESAMQWEHTLRDVEDDLAISGYAYDWMSEYRLENVEIDEEGFLTLSNPRGLKRRYAVLMVPPVPVLSETAIAGIDSILQRGGLVLFAGHMPEGLFADGSSRSLDESLEDWRDQGDNCNHSEDWPAALREWVRPPFPSLAQMPMLRSRTYDWNGTQLFLFSNEFPETWRGKLDSPSGASRVESFDLDRLTLESRSTEPLIEIEIPPLGALLVAADRTIDAEDDEAPVNPTRTAMIPIAEPLFFHAQRGNNFLLNEWALEHMSDIRSAPGELALEHRYTAMFHLVDLCEPLNIIAYGLDEFDELLLNGQPIEFSPGPPPIMIPVDALAGMGKNTLEVYRSAAWGEARPPLGPVWLQGDFAAIEHDHEWRLCTPQPRMPADSWTEHGYPDFAGIGVYRQQLPIPGETARRRARLSIENVYSALEVYINGEHAGKLWRPPWRLDVTGRLKPGANLFVFHAATSGGARSAKGSQSAGMMGPIQLEVFDRVF